MGDWAWGMGHGAWGIGQGFANKNGRGMVHGAWGIGHGALKTQNSISPLIPQNFSSQLKTHSST
ncbi:hypothetical protein [Microcoleus sp. FACHB-68]|uniref:hypothetical protein n=1 Tax=Microcoleus sp. FACHB-68 TaxID=2692826 RepID=UPI0016862207|nr:hypothetical protein [Microcoleus sp. FACHB-68]MBD1938762.1 hypothetical protein [Microcoleus sp. FACHB-68]